MKWALIYVLASGIWDTGLRFPASEFDGYEKCQDVALLARAQAADHNDNFEGEGAYRMDVIRGQWFCLPAKK